MNQEQSLKAAELEESVSKLKLSDDTALTEAPEKQNPWQDSSPILDLAGSSSSNPVVLQDENEKDIELQQNPFASGAATPPTNAEEEERRRDVLQEFDPLANQEEKAAREGRPLCRFLWMNL